MKSFFIYPLLLWLCLYSNQVYSQNDTWLETNTGIADYSAGETFEVNHIATLENGRTLAFIEQNSGTNGNGVYELNSSTWTWTKIAPSSPNDGGFNKVIIDQNRVFDIRRGAVNELNLSTGTWEVILESIPGIPDGRIFSTESIVNGKLYLRTHLRESSGSKFISDFPEENFQENELFITIVDLQNFSIEFMRNPQNPFIMNVRGGNANMSLVLSDGRAFLNQTWDYRANDGFGGFYEWTGTDWVSASAGLNVINITGSGFGPIGPIYTDVSKTRVFIRTEQGFFEKVEGGWLKYLGRTAANFYITPDYLFVENIRLGKQILQIDRAVRTSHGANFADCLSFMRHFMTPDNGGFFLGEPMQVYNDEGDCVQNNNGAVENRIGIYRYAPSPDKPGTVSNLHLDVGTYLGGVGENKVAETVILPSGRVLIAGVFNDNMGTSPTTLLSATANSKGKIFVMSADGTTVEQSIILGEEIKDMDINAGGEIALTGDFGIAVLNPDYTLKWSQSESIGKGRIAIADDGKVVALLASADNGGGIVKLYGNDGSVIHTNTNNDNNGVKINDLEISSAAGHNKYYVGGFTQVSGVLQVAYIYAYGLTTSTDRLWKTWGFGSGEVNTGENGADTRVYRIKATSDKLFIAGESAGGGPGGFTVFAYNGKDLTTRVANNGNDFYTDGTNSCGPCHITFLGRINPTDGAVERGKFFHGRLSGGKTNTHKVDEGDLEIDDEGNILLVGTAAARIQDRDIFNINGNLAGSYAGGDQFVLMTTPNFQTRYLWGVFSKERGGGDDNRIAFGNGRVAYIATSTRGTLMTTNNAIKSEPYNTVQEDHQLSQSDVYFALWDRDVWETANLDELERPFISQDSCFRVDNLPCRTESPRGTSILDLIKAFNIITPNGDNRNDTWLVTNLNLASAYKIRVFTKNGQVVFETDNYEQNWGGTHNGQPLPAGVYYYSIVIAGERKPKTGYITIVY